MEENYTILSDLKKNQNIQNAIFSFDKWSLEGDLLKTTFYFGDAHEKFTLNEEKGIIGSCKAIKSDLYWGCFFDYLSFNGKEEALKNDTHDYSKIFFSSEIYDIIIPNEFKTNFDNLTNKKCFYGEPHLDEQEYTTSCNIFNDTLEYASIELINEDMNITIQIDSLSRYNQGGYLKNMTRIRFLDVQSFIFPLIMFKNFHIQFNDEKDLISFYTEDSTILKVKKEDKKSNDKGSSNGLIAFLIIFIILLVLVIAFGIFWLIKRKSSIEKNINKYNKFDEDDNFQNMNEKRVF